MMKAIAVAGGSGGVGRAIVDELVRSGEYKIFVLARKTNDELERTLGVRVLAVDYSNVPSITTILEENGIEIVISAITTDLIQSASPETALIQASDESKSTKRIISSNWSVPYTEEHLEFFSAVEHKLRNLSQLKKTELSYTTVVNGCFLDYWCTRSFKSYMTPATTFIDIANDFAAIPGTGDTPVTFTHTADVARYVVALLQKESWDPISYIVGDRVTMNQFLRLAEAAKGTKFEVVYDNQEKLKDGQATTLPIHASEAGVIPLSVIQEWSSKFGLMFDNGVFDIAPPGVRTLNEEFPDIKPLTVQAALQQEWA